MFLKNLIDFDFKNQTAGPRQRKNSQRLTISNPVIFLAKLGKRITKGESQKYGNSRLDLKITKHDRFPEDRNKPITKRKLHPPP